MHNYNYNSITNIGDIIQALANSGISIFMYYPQEKKIVIPEKICRRFNCEPVYLNMPDGFAEEYVCPEDRNEYKELFYQINGGAESVSGRYRSHDYNFCLKITMTTVTRDENGNPCETLGVVEDAKLSYRNEQLTEQMREAVSAEGEASEMAEVMKLIAASIGGQYYAIYHIWPDSHSYICFREKSDGIMSAIGEKGTYETAWETFLEKFIEPDDKEAMREFADLSTLAERLQEHHSISRNFCRKGLGWTRGTFIAGKRDKEGKVTNVIYTVSDINEEIRLEDKQKRTVYEAEHDALTGVYNRKGFEAILDRAKTENEKVGFLILDIDNLKTLNDHFGHVVGDEVLVAVAEQLTSVFYTSDIIARIGGDEFAILLKDCDDLAWNKICTKLRTIHTNLAGWFPENSELSVTLSCGISFSETGYHKKMYELADEGLYETKKLGRAGCTLISPEHQVLERWQDEAVSLYAKNVLEYNNTGLCQIEIFLNQERPRRLICGETAKSVMGIPKNATPEECYIFWRDGIDPAYREALFKAEQSMIEFGQTECTFCWNHPDYGKIFLRCGGFGEKKGDMIVLSGYCHTLKDTHIIEKQDDRTQIFQALNETFVSSYYLDLENETAEPFKISHARDYMSQAAQTLTNLLEEFSTTVVDPRDREIMRDFLDMDTLQKRLGDSRFIDAEYRSLVLGCWCRVRLLPVKFDRNGKLSHVLLTIVALDSGDFKEVYTLDYNRRSLAALFDHLPCGAVMYEWNGHSLETVHISKYYKEHASHMFVKEDGNSKLSLNFSSIHPDDQIRCHRAITRVLKETHELHQEYRVWSEQINAYVWERVDAVVSPQLDGVQFIYAVYTDITQRKEQELRLEKNHASLLAALNASNQLCYEYDPIRHRRECLTDDNFFGMPKVLENYPEALIEIDLVHPEDVNKFIRTAHLMDAGNELAQCDVRIKTNGEYCWYACTFNGYYDSEKNQQVAILTVIDVSLRMETLKNYEERLHSMAAITDNTICMTMLNLTKSTYEIVECKDEVKYLLDDSLPLEEFVMKAGDGIVGEENRKRYKELFNPKYLLQQANEGNMRVETEYILKMGTRYEWVLSAVDLMRNPITEEVSGTAYNISIQTDKMNKFLLERTLEQDYLFAAAIFVDTDEFFLFNPSKGKFSKRMENYWGIALKDSRPHCSEEIFNELQRNITKENILNYLETNSEYRYTYDAFMEHQLHRLEVGFCYADLDRTMLLASMRNITDADLLEKYRHDSEHDSLTDLYNRRTMFRKCRELLESHPEDLFVMLHADIKHFRLYNTFFGDAAGDKLLCDMAKQFRRMAKDYDYWTYGRIEADVFAAFFPYNEELYRKHLNRILEDMRTYRLDFLIEPAIGMYFITDRDMSIESMFTRATLAAKIVKPDTPYATVVFDEEMEKTLKYNQEILNDMQTAIDQKQFEIYLQPKYSLKTNKPVGAEALVRWIHPVRGLISPGRFIPVFEGNGFIAELDRYMWENTCRLLSRWQKNGHQLLPVSVNVSRISAYSQDTVSFLKSLVRKYDIDPRYLELELTESAYVESPEEIRSRLKELQEYGFKILMDDFGSGYSSLNTLKDIPLDILKLDMKFLSSTENKRGSMILSSIVRMSKLLNLPVIAEGVEEEAQADYLRSIGCEYVQGFLFDRPMPISDFEGKIFKLMSETNNIELKQKELLVSDVLLESSDTLQMIDDSVPNPVILVGYRDNEFNCLRMNKAFIRDFGLTDDFQSAEELFREHLSEQNYDRMLRAFKKCSETNEPLYFKIGWDNENDRQHEYLVNAVCEGNIGEEKVLIVAFIDIEPDNLFE